MSHDDDLDGELDRRLNAAGESWRAQHQPAPVSLPGRRRRPAWVVPLAAAASVALLAGGAAVAVEVLGGHRDGSAPADTEQNRWDPDLPPGLLPAEVPGAVPPVNQVVRFPQVEAAGAYHPRLDDAAGAPPCSADDVRFSAEPQSVGVVRMAFTAVGPDVRCAVSQMPFLQYLRDGEYVEVLGPSSDPQVGDWPTSVLVTLGRPAVLQAAWSGWCVDEPRFDTIEAVFDDSSVTRLAAPTPEPCPGTDFADDRMRLFGWEPEGYDFESRARFGDVQARLVDTVEGPRGLPTWVVELTAVGRDVDLDVCPSWEVRQGEEQSASWRLNCGGVPDKRADGTPYLPAGKPVRFAIWTSYGGTDAALTWRLTTADGPVTVKLTEGPEAPTGEPRRVVERDANLHLWLSNQSFHDPSVKVAVEVDGVPLVDEVLAVEGQHTFVAFHLAVPAGRHEVVVTSDSGARVERTITVPARGDRWAAALYWAGETPPGPSFDWILQDHPIGWA